jgi:hypothetical protein
VLAAAGCCALAACSILEHQFPDRPSNQGIDNLIARPTIDTADGERVDTLLAVLDPRDLPSDATVTFRTSAGQFLPSGTSLDMVVDPDHTARALLRAPSDSTKVTVTASFGGVTKKALVLFIPAPPSAVHVVPKSPTLLAGSLRTVDITAFLVRQSGSVSPGFIVDFAIDAAECPTCQLSAPSRLASDGSATVTLSVRDSLFGGTITVSANAKRGALAKQGTAKVTIVPAGLNQRARE